MTLSDGDVSMNEVEALEVILTCIGVETIGKQRWFQNGSFWYDRVNGDRLTLDDLADRVCDVIREEMGMI